MFLHTCRVHRDPALVDHGLRAKLEKNRQEGKSKLDEVSGLSYKMNQGTTSKIYTVTSP